MGSLLGWFLSPVGLVVLAALDSSVVFFLPLALDLVVVLLAARHPDLFWLFPALATAGSLAGAATTYWVGERVGRAGLSRFVSTYRLDRLESRLEERGAVAIGALALLPPPFPFTAYVVGAGAIGVDRAFFFSSLAGARLLRTGTEAVLASRYGRSIVAWTESTGFEVTVAAVVAIALLGTAWGAWRGLRIPG